MLRLQGFPESFKIVCSDSQTRTQAGNSLPIPVAKEVLIKVLQNLIQSKNKCSKEKNKLAELYKNRPKNDQLELFN